MLKNWYTRLARIASGSFGTSKEDGFSLEAGLTKFERFVHFWVLVCRSFVRNRCPVRASSLSYTTLLALIPILAVAMGVTNAILESKGEAQIRIFIEQFVEKVVPSAAIAKPTPIFWSPQIMLTNLDSIEFGVTQARAKYGSAPLLITTNEPTLAAETNGLAALPENSADTNAAPLLPAEPAATSITEAKQTVAKQAANFIYDFAKRSSSKTLGLTGMLFLILTAIMMLTRVEETFNDIWGVTRGRDWWSRITNYTFTIGFGPMLLVLALGLMNSPGLQKSLELIRHVPMLAPMLTRVLPLLIICFTFAMFYKLIPNTKVDFAAAFVGGTLAGISWHGYNRIAVWIAASAVRNGGNSGPSVIYGSLAMIPLMMGGLYVVWLTVLFGAQVAYAFQNRASYLQDRLVENVNQRGREFVALRLMTCIGQRFQQGLLPATIREISTELGIPSKLVQQIMRTLLAAGLVVEVTGREIGYSPARPLEAINCHHILLAMRATHGQEPATRDEPVRGEVLGEFARIQDAERTAAASVSMLALVNRAQARLSLEAATGPAQAALRPPIVAPEILPPAAAEGVVIGKQPEVNFSEAEEMQPEIQTPVAAARPEVAIKPTAAPGSISPPTPVSSTSNNENESFPL